MHPKYSALFVSINLLLGVGPLIIPMPFFNTGIGLSITWMIIIIGLSYLSAMFVGQSMAKVHQIEMGRTKQSSLLTDSQINDHTSHDNSQNPSSEFQEGKIYEHTDQFVILYGSSWKYLPYTFITAYLFGTCTSKCIMTAKTLTKIFQGVDGWAPLQNFNFWLCVFFLSGAVFSFRSIDKTKFMQAVIIFIRALSIILMIGGAMFLIVRDGVKDLAPTGKGYFNFSTFLELLSNSVFALLCHHCLPGIMTNLKNPEDIRFAIKYAFFISGSILIILPLTACMAFGEDLGNGFDLKYYNFDFKGKIDFIFWIVSFYVFLNISVFSVCIIVIRINILSVLNNKINPRTLSKHTIICSVGILGIVLTISAFLQDHIQIVLDFTGGIFGMGILFFIPPLEVWKARRILHKQGQTRNFISWLPIFVVVIGFIFLVANIYHIISKIVHPSDSYS